MPRRVLQGIVKSTKMQNTITVEVIRREKHPLYKKFIKINKKYHAHNENADIQVGDTVSIIESKPISKTVKWVVVEGSVKKSKENKQAKE